MTPLGRRASHRPERPPRPAWPSGRRWCERRTQRLWLSALVPCWVLAVGDEAYPDCTFESCPQCLLNIKTSTTNLSITGPDTLVYSSPLRIARAPAYWDSQSLVAQMVGILTKEKLGINVDYVPCEDEAKCTFGTCTCSGYNDDQCNPVSTLEQATEAVREGSKVYADPLADIFLLTEVRTHFLAREAFDATNMDYDSKPIVVLGPTGYTACDGVYHFPDLYQEAWEQFQADTDSMRSFARPEVRNLTDSPQKLIDEGVEAEFQGCSADPSSGVEVAMQYHRDQHWVCNEKFWWVNEACAAYGDQWTTQCMVLIEDDWGFSKPGIYDFFATSEIPIAKIMVGYDPWWELIYYKAYNVLFTWWSPDASVQNQKGRRVNMPHGEDVAASIVIKVGYEAALRVDERLAFFLTTMIVEESYILELMDVTSDVYGEGYEAGDSANSFYQKLACDWLRANEEVWSEWLPSAKSCSSGEYFDEESESCEQCPTGTAGATSIGGELYCKACDAGTFSEFQGLTACTVCPKGSFVQESGQTRCELCYRGSYSNTTAQSACMVCEVSSSYTRTTDSKGSISSEACMCPEGSYEERAQVGCKACPEGMTCPFGSSLEALKAVIQGSDDAAELVYPVVEEGYYTLASDPLSVYLCDYTADYVECPGGAPQTCGFEHVGLICSVCREGYAMLSDGSCVTCDSPVTLLFVASLPVALLAVTLSLFLLTNDPITWDMSTALFACLLFSIVVTTFQSVALLTGLRVAWKAQGRVFGSFELLLGSPNGLRTECTLTSSAAASYLFRCSLPLVCALGVALVWLVARIVQFFVPKVRAFTGVEAQNTLGQVLHTVFICIAVLVVQPLRCYWHPNGKSSLSAYPQVLCWESTEHIVIIVAGVGVGFLFLIPFMAGCIWAMVRAPAMTTVDQLMRWRFLVYRFRPEIWWWGIVFLVRQVLFAFSSCIPAEQSLMQITYFSLVGLIYVAIMCTQWPWKSSLLNFFDAASVFMLAVISISASAFTDGASDTEVTFFVYFHLTMFSLFVFAVLAAFAAMGCTMIKNKQWICDFKTPFSVTNKHELIQQLWIDFIENSSRLPPAMINEAIDTFTEYDLLLLLKCMSAFGSVSADLKPCPSLLHRLCTTSHPRVDVGRLDTQVSSRLRETIRARCAEDDPAGIFAGPTISEMLGKMKDESEQNSLDSIEDKVFMVDDRAEM